MKKSGFFLMVLCISTAILAQQKPTELDKSPMDMCYWPANYPILKMSGKARDLPVARVIYGRPAMNGRSIFGGIIKYNDLWRLGANEATELELFSAVKLGNKILAKGRYTLFCIPSETKWTIIISKDNFCWGSFTYDIKKDIVRTDIKPEKNDETVEIFTIFFEDKSNSANLVFLWDDLKASIPLTVVNPNSKK
ncbi:MAG: DUF2911 domain-containing protein [Sphingobacteriia bacterium]|jgi:hypothetical protein|nr:MAG: DUF2911 domain-containing protein [Sphingobacteriia bacterium]